jgi:hypothetical protein
VPLNAPIILRRVGREDLEAQQVAGCAPKVELDIAPLCSGLEPIAHGKAFLTRKQLDLAPIADIELGQISIVLLGYQPPLALSFPLEGSDLFRRQLSYLWHRRAPLRKVWGE